MKGQRRRKPTKLDKTKMKASKAVDLVWRIADAHVRKWKRRFVLASFLVLLSLASLALVRWLE